MDGDVLREDQYAQNGIHKINELSRPTFILHCSVTGMELRFNGRTVVFAITDEYINRQCGVCGHSTLDSEDTLRKDAPTLASSMKEFHASYLYRGEECTTKAQEDFDQMKEEAYHKRDSTSYESDEDRVDNMEKKREGSDEKKKSNKGKKHRKGNQQSNEYSSEFDSQYKTTEAIPMTKVIEEQDMICFSLQPQKGCPQGSYPIVENAWSRNSDESEDPEVEFICKSRRDSQARKLLKQLRRDKKVIEDLKTMQSNRKMPVKQVKRCSRQQQMMPAEY